MRTLEPLLPRGIVPRVLFEDRENYLFGMEAVAAEHTVWKAELLDGTADSGIAARCGDILADIHARTWNNADLRRRWSDREVFDQLRLDPFYRYLIPAHPDLAQPLDDLIDTTLATSLCVVHADFSPKNILLTRPAHGTSSEDIQIALVDYETGHFGDPAFDLGFFLSHLLLKTIRHADRQDAFLALSRTFWDAYRTGLHRTLDQSSPAIEIEPRGVKHLAACMLARIDGKSTVDYLVEDQQQRARRFACDLLHDSPGTLGSAFDELERRLGAQR